MKFHATFTRCRDGKPLLELDGQSFNGLEIRPAALRHLGQMLEWLATAGEFMPTAGPNWKPSRVEVDMDTLRGSTATNDINEAAYCAVQFINNFAKPANTTHVAVISSAQIEAAREKRSAGQIDRLAQKTKVAA